MLANYHTHTKRCRHAHGEDREYIENAIKAGIEILGFSDHAPYLFDETWYYSHYRMFVDQIDEYASSINALKREYQSDIKIYLGFELEYYKNTHQREITFLKKYNPDYLILGQHFVGGETTGCYVACQDDDNILSQYVSECIEGLKTGHFTYIAHPDIIGYDYSSEAIEREYTRLLTFAKENGFPIEINCLGLQNKKWYPRRKIFEIASRIGNDVIIGVDAHVPTALSKQTFENARNFAHGLNLNIIEKVNLIKP